jgi:hypothetical protein
MEKEQFSGKTTPVRLIAHEIDLRNREVRLNLMQSLQD